MTKKRKTRNQKIRARKRSEEGLFSLDPKWLGSSKKAEEQVKVSAEEKSFFKADLTKTLLLSMLVLALEFALWQYLSTATTK